MAMTRALASNVPIQHSQIIHQVRTRVAASDPSEASFPGDAVVEARRGAPGEYTLLELVEAIADVTDDEREIVATVVHLLASGQVRLCGNFRDEPVERILAS